MYKIEHCITHAIFLGLACRDLYIELITGYTHLAHAYQHSTEIQMAIAQMRSRFQ